MIVYKTTNLFNGKIYVGKDCGRPSNYLGSGIILKQAIKKYGKENFKKEVLEVCDLSNICEREIYWINKLNSRNPKIGYNISRGADGFFLGCHHTEKTKRKISKAIPWIKGRHHSKESNKVNSDKHKGQIPWNKGKKNVYSEKTIEKIRNSKRGTFHSKETKEKIRKSNIGKHDYLRHPSLKTRELMSLSKRGSIPWNKGKRGRI